jgi:hypothetical protein
MKCYSAVHFMEQLSEEGGKPLKYQRNAEEEATNIYLYYMFTVVTMFKFDIQKTETSGRPKY